MLAAAAVTIMVMGGRYPNSRRATIIAAYVLIPLAAAWFALSTAMAWRSF